MVKIFERNREFYFLTALYVMVASVLWALFPKGHLVLWFNHQYSPLSNFLFTHITNFGDGLFSIFICILLLFVRYYWAWLVFISYGISSLLAQFLKKVVFSDFPRPKGYFGTDTPIQFIEGVEIYSYNSFPSGHTTSAFALACILALIFPGRWKTFGLASLAILTAISRIYLGQHFVEDTIAGAIIGTATASWVYYWQEKSSKWKGSEKSILNKQIA